MLDNLNIQTVHELTTLTGHMPKTLSFQWI